MATMHLYLLTRRALNRVTRDLWFRQFCCKYMYLYGLLLARPPCAFPAFRPQHIFPHAIFFRNNILELLTAFLPAPFYALFFLDLRLTLMEKKNQQIRIYLDYLVACPCGKMLNL